MKDENNVASYLSSAAMIMGGSTRIGIGKTTLVTAVSKSACGKKKKKNQSSKKKFSNYVHIERKTP